MTDNNRFFRLTLNVEARDGKLRINETRCAGYYTAGGKDRITACVGRSMTLPASVATKKRAKKRAA